MGLRMEALDQLRRGDGGVVVAPLGALMGHTVSPDLLELSVLDIEVGRELPPDELADHLVERGAGGSIVLTGSVVARIALPLAPHYTASKGAVLSFGRALAGRLGRHGIRVNVLSPGWVETEMAEGVISDERSAGYFMSRIPLRRWGTAEDFEGPAVFLASPASRFMTGAELVVDGGISSA